MGETPTIEAPQTLEGWYILHDVYSVDWEKWRALAPADRESITADATRWLTDEAGCEKGDSVLYSVLTQKGDLMFVHYRESPDVLNRVELSLRQSRLFDFLVPTYSYFSVIEIGLYELTGLAHRRLAELGIRHESPEFATKLEEEMAAQRERIKVRLFRNVPEQRYICFYPMSKRRGEQVNWYTLNMEERRNMMRGHGRIGHKYHEQVTQIIGGSVALDDWEWGVSLHADDMLVFKKLVYEMRFDQATSLFAQFGPFYLGIRTHADALANLLAGKGT